MYWLQLASVGVPVAAALSYLCVGLVRGYAIRRSILDVPNERSSHARVVPRGGGLGLVAVFLALAPLTLSAGQRSPVVVLCLAAAALVGWIGWLDDRAGISVRARLAVHLGAGTALALLASSLGASPLWALWWLFCAVASINIVNFMDGIDGLVASQVAIFAGTIVLSTPAGTIAHGWAIVLAGACLGFLGWNWPPARIFLGDVGSGALGFLCATIGVLAILEVDRGLFRVFLPLFPLYFDAAWTLGRRVRNGERVSQAHRSHLYQRLANDRWGHRFVTLLYGIAALVGGAVSLQPADAAWPYLAAAFAMLVVAVGAALDRTRPFVWRDRVPDRGTVSGH